MNEPRHAHEVRLSDDGATFQGQVVAIILEGARRGSVDPLVRRHASELVAGLDQWDRLGQLTRLWRFYRDEVPWLPDPATTEWVQGARATLAGHPSDCDDKTLAFMAAAASLGFDCAAVLSAPDQAAPFNHVYPAVQLEGQWVPADVSDPQLELGQQVPAARRELHPLTMDTDPVAGGYWQAAESGRVGASMDGFVPNSQTSRILAGALAAAGGWYMGNTRGNKRMYAVVGGLVGYFLLGDAVRQLVLSFTGGGASPVPVEVIDTPGMPPYSNPPIVTLQDRTPNLPAAGMGASAQRHNGYVRMGRSSHDTPRGRQKETGGRGGY